MSLIIQQLHFHFSSSLVKKNHYCSKNQNILPTNTKSIYYTFGSRKITGVETGALVFNHSNINYNSKI